MIVYRSGIPPSHGDYAGRVSIAGIESDQFITWDGEGWRWSRNGAPIARNGEVLGWIGPLQRKLGEIPAEATIVVSPTELDEMVREFARRAMMAAFEKAGWDDELGESFDRAASGRATDYDKAELAGFAIKIMEFGCEDR